MALQLGFGYTGFRQGQATRIEARLLRRNAISSAFKYTRHLAAGAWRLRCVASPRSASLLRRSGDA